MRRHPGIGAPGGQPVLSVQDASKSYGDVTVLDGVTLTLATGEAAAVVGRNGAGKSTLLKCLVGAELLDGGTVRICGAELDESDPAVRMAVASLLDDVDFFPDISVVEHLRLLTWLHGVDAAESAVGAVLVDVGLDHVQDQLPPTLSSGQRHRLGLASCLVRPRRLLVLDEPEQRLDVPGREWLRARLLREKADGCAVVFASHDELLVESVADVRVEIDP